MVTRVYIADISPLENENIYSAYFEEMPIERRNRTIKYKSKDDRIRSVAAFTLLKKAYIDVTNSSDFPEIGYEKSGKAFFVDSPICFNLSHSGKRVLCAIGSYPNGCDVEKDRQKSLGIAKRFFAMEEYQYIDNHLPQVNHFTKIWTLKESVLKACGAGISYPMNTFCVVDNDKIAKKVTLSDDFGVYYIRNYPADDGYEISCACSEDAFDEKVRSISLGK